MPPSTWTVRPVLAVLAVLALVALVVPGVAGCQGPSKEQWSARMKNLLPAEVCKPGSYITECYGMSGDECTEKTRAFTEVCLREYADQLPERFDRATGEHWGSKVGQCAGNRIDVAMADRFRSTPKCQDPSAWTP